MPKRNKPERIELAKVKSKVTPEVIKKIFRMVFADGDCLIEIFPNPVIVYLDDIKLLNRQIAEKLSRHDTSQISLKAIISFDNGRSLERADWDKFISSDWSTPDTINSISLTWRFMLVQPTSGKPSLHSLNVRITSSINPRHLFQTLFSKDPEDFDKIDIAMSTMSIRIDFVDYIIGQEMLDLLSRWNKALSAPSFVLPSLMWIKRHLNSISSLIRRSIPVFTTISCFSYFIRYYREFTGNGNVSLDIFKNTIMWGIVSIGVIFIAGVVGRILSSIFKKQMTIFGRFSAIEITRGDKNKQTKLIAKNTNSIWKSIAGASLALVLNIAGGIIAAILLGR